MPGGYGAQWDGVNIMSDSQYLSWTHNKKLIGFSVRCFGFSV